MRVKNDYIDLEQEKQEVRELLEKLLGGASSNKVAILRVFLKHLYDDLNS